MVVDPANEQHILDSVEQSIRDACEAAGVTLPELFGKCVRQALDEVIDGPRTGRWSIDQLDTTEQSYIGTKVEIIVRTELGAEKGERADCSLGDSDTDVKWSRYYASWMIGPENVGTVCLGICTDAKQGTFSVGLFVPFADRLRRGTNRDRKLQMKAEARDRYVRWLVHKEPLPRNFIADLAPADRAYIFAGKSAQERVRRVAERLRGYFIPRQAFETAAMRKGDPMRRLRSDKHNPDGLAGFQLLSTRYAGDKIRTLMGLSENAPLPADCWVSIDAGTHRKHFGDE
jgi:hypothetical protein